MLNNNISYILVIIIIVSHLCRVPCTVYTLHIIGIYYANMVQYIRCKYPGICRYFCKWLYILSYVPLNVIINTNSNFNVHYSL